MKDVISGKTIVCGIIGDPIEHTMSPVMHNAAFKTMGLDYIYIPFQVKSVVLRKAVEGIRGLNIRGMNVTVPHKVSILQFLDQLDPLAEKIGAVNTIVNNGGILTGYNTDAVGFLRALQEKDVDPAGKRVLLLGAGGAARAIGCILAQEKAQLTILNRRQELFWAENLAQRLIKNYKADVNPGELTEENLQKAIAKADIVVNATIVGMSPDTDQTPVPAEMLSANLTVFDIVYNPLQTELLREAKTAGAITISGLDMLVWQGAISFEKWTGQHLRWMLCISLSGNYCKTMKSNIALIGFMGTGKTVVGMALAKRLRRPLVEVDLVIERIAGSPIPDIFLYDGEIYFRELEIEAIKMVSGGEKQVIACGGGAVLNTINIDRLRETSVIINLAASLETILKRTAAAEGSRPLLNVENPAERIERLMKFRKPFYERAADFTINTSNLSIDTVIDKIIGRLKKYEGFNL